MSKLKIYYGSAQPTVKLSKAMELVFAAAVD